MNGWHKNIPIEDYHNGPELSSSGIVALNKSPGHYKCRNAFEATDTFNESSGAHCHLLEPGLFLSMFDIVSGTRTAKMKAEAAEAGITLLTQKQWTNIQAWCAAVLEHPECRDLINYEGDFEISGYWTDEKTGVKCRCRPDKLIKKHRIIADFKTMSTARQPGIGFEECFFKAIANYRYHWQAAWYLMGAEAITTHQYDWVWIVVEKEPPHQVGAWMATDDMLREGRSECVRLIDVFRECTDKNEWPKPAYEGIRPAYLPKWYKTIIE